MAQKWEFGGLAGASGYMGDLNPENPFAFNDWSVGAFAKYNFNNTWGVRGNVQYLNIWKRDMDSSNPWFQQRQLMFFSELLEFSAVGEFNFFNIYECTRGKKFWQPYVFGGLAYTYYEPKVRDPDLNKVYLRQKKTERPLDKDPYNDFTFAIPFGLGLKYKPRGAWVYGLEAGYRIAFTDYLDDVSGLYPDTRPYSDPSGVQIPGTMRGDGHRRDAYMFVGVRVSYILFNQGCPTW